MTPAELRAARHKLGVTQDRLAYLLGYKSGKTAIYQKETGKRPIVARDELILKDLLEKHTKDRATRPASERRTR
jgi:transcriptional regulator with XRE-family HTH domain